MILDGVDGAMIGWDMFVCCCAHNRLGNDEALAVEMGTAWWAWVLVRDTDMERFLRGFSQGNHYIICYCYHSFEPFEVLFSFCFPT